MRQSIFILLSVSSLFAGQQAPLSVSYADQRIALARKAVASDPKGFQNYNDLAAGALPQGPRHGRPFSL
jgi:hypothetical protein